MSRLSRPSAHGAGTRRLAAMEPVAAWHGHDEPVTGDVRAKLERALGRNG